MRAYTYDTAVEAIQLGVNECMADLGEDAGVDEDEVWADMASSILMDAPRSVAEEVCRVQLGWVPADLLSHWRQQDAAAAAVKEKRRLERNAQDRARRAAARAARKSALAVRPAICGSCFTVPTPSGACNCV